MCSTHLAIKLLVVATSLYSLPPPSQTTAIHYGSSSIKIFKEYIFIAQEIMFIYIYKQIQQ